MSTNPAHLLDSGQFHATAELSTTLPSHWYYDASVFERERESIFLRNWWYQCHVSQLLGPKPIYHGVIDNRPIEISRDDEGHFTARSVNSPVRLENYAGFLFVNFDDDALPLGQMADQFRQDMYQCCPRLDELVHVRRFEREIAANWKTLIDNNHECYHCNANHPSLMELVDYDNKAVWSNDSITFSHKVEPKNAENAAYSVDQSTLEQESLFGYIWPALIPLFFPGTPNLIMFQVLPLAPERSLLRHDYYLLDREPNPQELEFMDWFSNVLSAEDTALCESVQKGLRSQGYSQGRFIVNRERVDYSEHHVHFFQNLVRDCLTG